MTTTTTTRVSETAEGLHISPDKELVFRVEQLQKQTTVAVRLTNTSSREMAFKVLTTAPGRYTSRPASGFVAPGAVQTVNIAMQALGEWRDDMSWREDKLSVQSKASEGVTLLSELFAKGKKDIKETRLRVSCVRVVAGSAGSSGGGLESTRKISEGGVDLDHLALAVCVHVKAHRPKSWTDFIVTQNFAKLYASSRPVHTLALDIKLALQENLVRTNDVWGWRGGWPKSAEVYLPCSMKGCVPTASDARQPEKQVRRTPIPALVPARQQRKSLAELYEARDTAPDKHVRRNPTPAAPTDNPALKLGTGSRHLGVDVIDRDHLAVELCKFMKGNCVTSWTNLLNRRGFLQHYKQISTSTSSLTEIRRVLDYMVENRYCGDWSWKGGWPRAAQKYLPCRCIDVTS